METRAVVIDGPKRISVEPLKIKNPEPDEVVQDIQYSGISSGSENFFRVKPNTKSGVSRVPGYESVGELWSRTERGSL